MILRRARFLGRLLADTRGATLVEFAFVAPVLCLMLIGLFDLGFQAYAQSALQGAVQEAARKSSLEPTVYTTTALDADVTDAVLDVIPGATLTFERTNYENFEDVRLEEDYEDTNGNKTCDNGEPFEDVNGNGTWDADRGSSGQGGARDAVLYNVSASYDRLFPFAGFLNVPEKIQIDSGTVLRNQPYDEQAAREPTVENCT